VTAAAERDAIEALLVAAGVDAEVSRRLAIYGERLLTANRSVNLTGARDAAAVVEHVLDSLTLLPLILPGCSLVDVGSGGGFPGIPLAIAAGVRVTLVEPIGKKAAFLAATLRACELDGEAIAERAEVVARDARYREAFDRATARAVSRAPTVAELTLPLIRVGGRALLQRGAMDAHERQALDDAVPMLGARVVDDVRVSDGLQIVVLEKITPIGERFPRRNGVPEKRPLCW